MPSAVSNGGYFVHKEGLVVDGRAAERKDTGRPIGPTATRTDHAQIPEAFESDYAHVVQDGNKIGVSSGPLLVSHGQPTTIGNAKRFQYRTDGGDNSLNKYAGALTHASDANERAALSVREGASGAPSDVVLHALTANGKRSAGVTMDEWQHITHVGADPAGTRKAEKDAEPPPPPADVSTLNLDGGGSVFLGVRSENGVQAIARGGKPTEPVRPVANIIAAKPTGLS